LLVLALSLGTGLAVSFEPTLVKALPKWLQGILSSGIIAGGVTAIITNFLLPGDREKYVGDDPSKASPEMFDLNKD
jgi:xanthine/uracil permease